MNRLVALAIVAVIGYLIMTSKYFGNGCFKWCDVGKSLFALGLTSTASILVKGRVQPIRVVNNI